MKLRARYLSSSQMQVGGFEIPIDLDADDATFEKAFASLPAIAEVAAKAGARRAICVSGGKIAFHTRVFEVVRKRIDKIAKR